MCMHEVTFLIRGGVFLVTSRHFDIDISKESYSGAKKYEGTLQLKTDKHVIKDESGNTIKIHAFDL